MRNTSVVLLAVAGLACSTKQPARQSDSAAAAAPSTSATAKGDAPVASTETAVAPEVNPPGDIPDTQAFVTYSSDGGYSIEVPEGWARTVNGPSVTFVSKLDGVRVEVAPATAAPTAATVKTTDAKRIQAQARAVSITGTSDVTLPAGKAVLVKYESNSDPNSVTQKQVRLENAAYLIFKNGKLATVTFWAPKGADNVDQWNRMSKSFQWK